MLGLLSSIIRACNDTACFTESEASTSRSDTDSTIEIKPKASKRPRIVVEPPVPAEVPSIADRQKIQKSLGHRADFNPLWLGTFDWLTFDEGVLFSAASNND